MDRQYNGQKNTLEVITDGQTMQWPKEKGQKRQTMVDTTLQRKLKIEQHKPH